MFLYTFHRDCLAGDETDRRVVAALLAFTIILPSFFVSGQYQGNEIVLRVAVQKIPYNFNPIAYGDYWSWLVLQWIYERPILIDYDTQDVIPYIAVGSANISGKADSWGDCAIGNFGYSPVSSWENSTRQEAIIFYDFTNVKWHDGTQMTVRDVMFSFHAAARTNEASLRCLMDSYLAGFDWRTYVEWDPDTMRIEIAWEEGTGAALRFTLLETYSAFFTETISPLLLPYHIWGSKISGQEVDGARIWCDLDYDGDSSNAWKLSNALLFKNAEPVGSGIFRYPGYFRHPIKLVTWRQHFYGPNFTYRKYIEEHSPNQRVKQPTIDAMEFHYYRDTFEALWALESDRVDFISWPIATYYIDRIIQSASISCFQSSSHGYYPYSAIREDGSNQFHSFADGFYYLGYNLGRTSLGYQDGNASRGDVGKPLRNAISYCVDRKWISNRLLNNFGSPGNGPVYPSSDSYNNSLPKYDFNPEKAKQILAAAGYKVRQGSNLLAGGAAIAAAGDPNWWVNPNGSDIGSLEGGSIEILIPEYYYDSVRNIAGNKIAAQLRETGINAEARSMGMGTMIDLVERRDFDMYFLGWRSPASPADYLHTLFHSSNSETGENYPGYQNASFDSLIDLARSTDNATARKEAIMDAQAAIFYDLPVDVIYWRNKLIAYSTVRISGWIAHGSELFHRDSILNLRGPYLFKLFAKFINPQLAVFSNSTTELSIAFTSSSDKIIGNISVSLNATIGQLGWESGNTKPNGVFTTTFKAPYVPPTPGNIANGSLAFIQITSAASLDPDYAPSPPRFILVTVYPEESRFITVTLDADPDVLDDVHYDMITPGLAKVVAEVKDQTGFPIQNVEVNLTSADNFFNIRPESALTDAQGKATFMISCTNLSMDDGSVVEKAITVKATSADGVSMLSTQNYMYIHVMDTSHPETQLTPSIEYPVLEVAVTIAAILLAAGAYAFVKRRKWL